MNKCLICDSEFDKAILLTNHIKKEHHITYNEYYDAHLKKDYEGKCITCGKETKFERGKYRDYCCKSCMRKSSIIQAKTAETSIARHGGVGLGSNKIKEKAQKTCLEKYGVSNPFQTEQAKKNSHTKEAHKKYKETMLERYGVESPLQIQENREKFIQNGHTKEIEEKRKQSIIKSNLEKYGVEHTFQRDDIKETIKKSLKEKYGVEHPKQYDDFKNKDKLTRLKKSIQYCLDNDCTPNIEIISKYGTGWYQSGEFSDALIKHNNIMYVKNSYLDKIRDYKPIKVINRFSNFEKEIYDFVQSIYLGTIKHNDRTLIKPLELDIYIPDKNIAIECNGLYWHSTNIVYKSYHLNKTELCLEQNIRLIHIFEDEWNNHKDICKSIIASALGIYNEKIYARNCIIKDVSVNEAKEFLNNNHIQGYVNSSYRLGLYYNNELVQIITIGKSRYKKDEYELLRMCTKLNTQVIGGFSKLMKHQPYNCIHSYIDRSKFNGNSYYKSNFIFEDYTPPSYYYWSFLTNKLNRLSCQKSKLPKLLGDKFDNSKTEIQNMIDAGFYQIYDSGNIKVVYKKGN